MYLGRIVEAADAEDLFWTLFAFAALLGVTDVDPFVISVAQGSIGGAALSTLAAAILVAAASKAMASRLGPQGARRGMDHRA